MTKISYGDYNGNVVIDENKDNLDTKNMKTTSAMKKLVVKKYTSTEMREGPYLGFIVKVFEIVNEDEEEGFFSFLGFGKNTTTVYKVRVPELDAHIPEPDIEEPQILTDKQYIDMHPTYYVSEDIGDTEFVVGDKVWVQVDKVNQEKNIIIKSVDGKETGAGSGSSGARRSHKRGSGGGSGGDGSQNGLTPGEVDITIPTYEPVAGDMSHIKIAEQELIIFRQGQLKEFHEGAWKDIAKYWTHIKQGGLAKFTLRGGYKNRKNKAHWSAAFIQYCMRNNLEFQKLKSPIRGIGNHQHYWRAAEDNTNKIKKNIAIPAGDWIFLSRAEAKAIGYDIQVGDLAFLGKYPAIHGDIVTSLTGGRDWSMNNLRKIGGNVSNSVSVVSSQTRHIMTQSDDAKNKLIKYLQGGR